MRRTLTETLKASIRQSSQASRNNDDVASSRAATDFSDLICEALAGAHDPREEGRGGAGSPKEDGVLRQVVEALGADPGSAKDMLAHAPWDWLAACLPCADLSASCRGQVEVVTDAMARWGDAREVVTFTLEAISQLGPQDDVSAARRLLLEMLATALPRIKRRHALFLQDCVPALVDSVGLAGRVGAESALAASLRESGGTDAGSPQVETVSTNASSGNAARASADVGAFPGCGTPTSTSSSGRQGGGGAREGDRGGGGGGPDADEGIRELRDQPTCQACVGIVRAVVRVCENSEEACREDRAQWGAEERDRWDKCLADVALAVMGCALVPWPCTPQTGLAGACRDTLRSLALLTRQAPRLLAERLRAFPRTWPGSKGSASVGAGGSDSDDDHGGRDGGECNGDNVDGGDDDDPVGGGDDGDVGADDGPADGGEDDQDRDSDEDEDGGDGASDRGDLAASVGPASAPRACAGVAFAVYWQLCGHADQPPPISQAIATSVDPHPSNEGPDASSHRETSGHIQAASNNASDTDDGQATSDTNNPSNTRRDSGDSSVTCGAIYGDACGRLEGEAGGLFSFTPLPGGSCVPWDTLVAAAGCLVAPGQRLASSWGPLGSLEASRKGLVLASAGARRLIVTAGEAGVATASAMALLQRLLEIMQMPLREMRAGAHRACQSLLSALPPRDRMAALRQLIADCQHPSVASLLIGRLKDEVHAAWAAELALPPMERVFLTPHLLEVVASHLAPGGGVTGERDEIEAEMETGEEKEKEEGVVAVAPRLPDNVDSVMAALNLYRYLLLREAREGTGASSPTGCLRRSHLAMARQRWLGPLRHSAAEVLNEMRAMAPRLPSGKTSRSMQPSPAVRGAPAGRPSGSSMSEPGPSGTTVERLTATDGMHEHTPMRGQSSGGHTDVACSAEHASGHTVQGGKWHPTVAVNPAVQTGQGGLLTTAIAATLARGGHATPRAATPVVQPDTACMMAMWCLVEVIDRVSQLVDEKLGEAVQP
eukprot:jgi/Mesvir1/12464/Mv00617-RA.2